MTGYTGDLSAHKLDSSVCVELTKNSFDMK